MTQELNFTGIVQGIGFRPTARRIARELGLTGQVKNSGGNVQIIISGNAQALDDFVQRLVCVFEIRSYTRRNIDEIHFDDFSIVHSSKDSKTAFLTPDLATCSECEKQLRDKNDLRYHHPFISCVNCGPRYTIMKALPYDRETTTMADFKLCKSCQEEYDSINDRRAHAQTIACNHCGPQISITIDEAINTLKSGQILAIKDIGGFHLACRADKPKAVEKIRQIKGREKKPFAVMFKNIDEIKEYCRVSKKEEELLKSSARPIVLLDKIKDFDFSVCGDSANIGAFLPCNPIQIMILDKCSPLVMTSANISGEPIITDNEEIKKFKVKALCHDRDIMTPIDDSVLRVVDEKAQFIRRARGYVPLAIEIDVPAKRDTLCLGGDLKSAFAFCRDNYVFLSQQFGDLEDRKTLDVFRKSIDSFSSLHGFKAEKIVCDAHPNYYSSNLFTPNKKVQHHKAHCASVIAEHKLRGDALCFAFDGTGYGDDGAIWGSEVFIFNQNEFKRVEHLDYVKMTASDEISKDAGLALSCYTGDNELINSAIKAGINTVNSSSMGRLFDAVACLLNIKSYNSYEGECACALEATAMRAKAYYGLTPSFNPIEIINEIKNAHASKEELALGFHLMLCELILNTAKKYDIKQIVLSGGVFNNKILTSNSIKLLEENGFLPYINEKVPCGDGGIALGQAYISNMEET